MTTVPGAAPSTIPSGPSVTASTAAVSVTIVKTTSLCAATAAGVGQAWTPSAVSGDSASGRRA